MTVLDASFIAKLFIEEEGSPVAEEYIHSGRLFVAPMIARTEVASAITRAVRNRTMDEGNAKLQLDTWRRCLGVGTIRLIESPSLQIDAESLSLRLRHPLPDCLYLALAIDQQMSLITADRPFVDASRQHYAGIRHYTENMS